MRLPPMPLLFRYAAMLLRYGHYAACRDADAAACYAAGFDADLLLAATLYARAATLLLRRCRRRYADDSAPYDADCPLLLRILFRAMIAQMPMLMPLQMPADTASCFRYKI